MKDLPPWRLNVSLALSLAAVLCSAVVACASTPAAAPATSAATETSAQPAQPGSTASLFERLGGKPAIEAVVDRFLGNIAADKRVAHRFALADIGRVRGHLIDQICQAAGGPCTYAGGDMRSVHRNHHITDAEFGAVVEDLVAALDHFKVPEREKGELLGALGGLKGDIVGL